MLLMPEMLTIVFPWVASAGTVIGWVALQKHRSASYTKQVQEIYRQFVEDTVVEIGQLKEEIKMLRQVVESYKKKCDGCPNNKKKK